MSRKRAASSRQQQRQSPSDSVSESPDPISLPIEDGHLHDSIEVKAGPSTIRGSDIETPPKAASVVEIASTNTRKRVTSTPTKPINGSRPTSRRKLDAEDPGTRSTRSSSRKTSTKEVKDISRAKASTNQPAPTSIMNGNSSTPARSARKSRRDASPTKSGSTRNLATSKSTLKGKAKEDDIDMEVDQNEENEDEEDDDDLFVEPTRISRETFLANEALRRQREARNFTYKGDVDAPRLTRSGRLVAVRDDTEEDLDEYGEVFDENQKDDNRDKEVIMDNDTEEEEMEFTETPTGIDPIQSNSNILNGNSNTVEDTISTLSPVYTLPISARPHIIDILSTLTSQQTLSASSSVDPEEKNDAMMGLLKLLQGTVERGEGNSALITGARGVGKTRAVNHALHQLSSGSKNSPIIVHLSGLIQTNDRLAIREMGRQIAEAEGRKNETGEGEDEADDAGPEEEYAPTTLPSHLLALLTAPSPKAIIIIVEEFDLFTEHARQALLYCLLDVVQSVRTGPVETTGRGIAVIGVTSRVDTLLLLEKRVKSRFSHRMFRVISPLSSDGPGWKKLIRHALIPWSRATGISGKEHRRAISKDLKVWADDWAYAVDTLLEDEKFEKAMERLSGLTMDVRAIYRPFIIPMSQVLASQINYIYLPVILEHILHQIELSGWGIQTSKLRGLTQPALGILIIAKHLHYAGREEFNFAQVEEEYLKFARTKLVGSGKTRWPIGILRMAFNNLLQTSLLSPASSTTSNSSNKGRFAKVRCTLSPHEIVAFFRESGNVSSLSPELISWGRMMGGHA